jgi:hypothetical protein
MPENAPKSDDTKKDGVTTGPQSGTATGGQPTGGSNTGIGTNSAASATPITSPSQPAGTPPGTGDPASAVNLKKDIENRTIVKEGPTENLTRHMHGVAGKSGDTEGGTLNSDKSVRDTRSEDEKNKEMEEKAGSNPLPNREGNEFTRAMNDMSSVGGPAFITNIDVSTTAMADELSEILQRNRTGLNKDDRDKLDKMIKNLRATGKR